MQGPATWDGHPRCHSLRARMRLESNKVSCLFSALIPLPSRQSFDYPDSQFFRGGTYV